MEDLDEEVNNFFDSDHILKKYIYSSFNTEYRLLPYIKKKGNHR